MDLVQQLTVQGVLAQEWVVAFLSVPRRQFVPDTVWVLESDSMFHPVHRADQPDRWEDLAVSAAQVVTQVDDGEPAGPGGLGDLPSSSCSMPSMVALMLAHLRIRGDEQVLEIGTGTGWNAALLAHRLGPERVTTVEIDHEVARHSRQALIDAGYAAVTALVGNGTQGCPQRAPFDRVICTAACHTVPLAWVAQCRRGGRIVTPWGREFGNWALLALDVGDDQTATGTVVDTASFMRLRDQRIPFCPVAPTEEQEAAATRRTTSLTPSQIMLHTPVLMAMTARIENCQARYRAPAEDPDGEAMLFLADRHTGSWARLHADPASHGPHPVVQHGQRHLFDEVESTYHWWTTNGCPTTDRWRVTVDRTGQRIELT